MKGFNKVLKVLLILAAIAGIIYVVAAYGERIVAWAKSLLARMRGKNEYVYAGDDAYDTTDEADFEA